jgi:hypothetical protein
MLNLARTRLILGSGYSSYSEVAAQMGGSRGNALPILMAGRDFGTIVERKRSTAVRWTPLTENVQVLDLAEQSAEQGARSVQTWWPKPF